MRPRHSVARRGSSPAEHHWGTRGSALGLGMGQLGSRRMVDLQSSGMRARQGAVRCAGRTLGCRAAGRGSSGAAEVEERPGSGSVSPVSHHISAEAQGSLWCQATEQDPPHPRQTGK